ncbi:sulfite exporter TauE/SafE family protein [Luteolibacter algae]|uniref:Sulfite exporter TauE/SafE family protein n=1 Tax=Luteolibacter algae TaxID=454151 RepID=A0ABW5D3E6_9BACT
MDPVHTTLGALIAGLVTSVHCVGMCGPIACGMAAMPATETERLTAMTVYHGARLTAYATIGAICGALGRQPLEWFFGSPAVLLPWVLVAVFLIFGLGLEKKLPRPPALLKWTAKMRFKLGRLSPVRSGLAIGFLTPLLPCGPLYLLFGAALLTGSAMRGAEFALAFGLGTVPLLWLAQHQLKHLQKRFKPTTLVRMQRSLALLSACIMAFRLWGTLPHTFAPASDKAPASLPSCCH